MKMLNKGMKRKQSVPRNRTPNKVQKTNANQGKNNDDLGVLKMVKVSSSVKVKKNSDDESVKEEENSDDGSVVEQESDVCLEEENNSEESKEQENGDSEPIREETTDEYVEMNNTDDKFIEEKNSGVESVEKTNDRKIKQSSDKSNLSIVELKRMPKGNLQSKKQRYVVFVGNLPYSCTSDDVRNHFLLAGCIIDVRLYKCKTNEKPKGYGFVEFQDANSFEKALSMNKTILGGRRLNVEYSGNNKTSEQKKEVKKKNFKLQAMRKNGKLEGGLTNSQKRRARRNKAKKNESEQDV